ncbi:sodium/glutamate symporter [Staphylococcus aureus]
MQLTLCLAVMFTNSASSKLLIMLSNFLKRICIPAPVIGGLIFAILVGLWIHLAWLRLNLVVHSFKISSC